MQRHKSVEKRVRTSKKKNRINRSGRSQITTATNKVLSSTDPAEAQEALKKAFSILDKSVKAA